MNNMKAVKKIIIVLLVIFFAPLAGYSVDYIVRDDVSIDSTLNVSGSATIDSNLTVSGGINSIQYRQIVVPLNMLTIENVAYKIGPNLTGSTATIDSIYTEGTVEDQPITIYTKPFGGGVVTTIDAHTVSTEGTGGIWYNKETTLTSTAWNNDETLYILKAGTDTDLTLTIIFHYTETRSPL